MLDVYTDSELKKRFGSFTWVDKDDGAIKILDDDWLSSNLAPGKIPQLVGIATYSGRCFGNVYCHRQILGPLQAAFAEIEKEGLMHHVVFWGGLFNPRFMRDHSKRISRHSYGIAFDINPKQNKAGTRPAPQGQKGSVIDIVPIFEKHGFAWGGDWDKPDGMHFEYAKRAKVQEKAKIFKERSKAISKIASEIKLEREKEIEMSEVKSPAKSLTIWTAAAQIVLGAGALWGGDVAGGSKLIGSGILFIALRYKTNTGICKR